MENNLPEAKPVEPMMSPTAPVQAPKKGLIILPLAMIGFIVILLLGGLWYLRSVPLFMDSIIYNGEKTSEVKVSPKYATDTDGDQLPDVIEKELNLDPEVDQVKQCYANPCADATYGSTERKTRNIVVLLDSSGSMGVNMVGETKMAAAKRAITRFVAEAAEGTKIGLIQYGHQGSNSSGDKAESCKSAEVIAKLGMVDSGTVSNQLAAVKPVGWTPIGLAINLAAEQFEGKENEINEIVVLSDGEETCGTDPISAARNVVEGPAKVKVNVIGFGVTSKEIAGLQAISSAGKGSFNAANSGSELEAVLVDKTKNFKAYLNQAECISKVLTDMTNCISGLRKQASDYNSKILSLSSKEISPTDRNSVSQAMTKYSSYLNQVFTEKSNLLFQMKKESFGRME